jgi:hypothetical protein
MMNGKDVETLSKFCPQCMDLKPFEFRGGKFPQCTACDCDHGFWSRQAYNDALDKFDRYARIFNKRPALVKENDSVIVEVLAEIESRQWRHWATSVVNDLPAERQQRWQRYLQLEYCDLNDNEQEKDRFWARRALNELRKKGYAIVKV